MPAQIKHPADLKDEDGNVIGKVVSVQVIRNYRSPRSSIDAVEITAELTVDPGGLTKGSRVSSVVPLT